MPHFSVSCFGRSGLGPMAVSRDVSLRRLARLVCLVLRSGGRVNWTFSKRMRVLSLDCPCSDSTDGFIGRFLVAW